MKVLIAIDMPDVTKNDPMHPYSVEVKLDYCNEVTYMSGQIHSVTNESEDDTEVILDEVNNLMICPHCKNHIGCACDWTPNFCKECGGRLIGGLQYNNK